MTFIRKNHEPEKFWNKLVGDNVPHNCHMKGLVTVTRGLNDEEYLIELRKKLGEEKTEFLEAKNPTDQAMELADVLDVIRALRKMTGETTEVVEMVRFVNDERKALGLTASELEKVRKAKFEIRGGFEDRIFLISTRGAC